MNDVPQQPSVPQREALSPSKRLSWNAVFLVCKDCRKRRNGPKKLKAKELVVALRRESRDAKPRPRVFTTGCLGLCPKAATAVAMVGAGVEPRVVAIRTRPQVEQVVALLRPDSVDAAQ